MFCHRCWTLLDRGASFCGRCGEFYLGGPEEARVDLFLTGFDSPEARERLIAYLVSTAPDLELEKLGDFLARLPTAFLKSVPEETAKPLVLKLSDLGARLYVRASGDPEAQGAGDRGAKPVRLSWPTRLGRRASVTARRLARSVPGGNRSLYAGLILITALLGMYVIRAVSRYESPREAALRDKAGKTRLQGTHFPLVLDRPEEPPAVHGFLGFSLDPDRKRAAQVNAAAVAAYGKGAYAVALERFSEALRADPNNLVIRGNIASALVEIGREMFEREDLEGAVRQFRRALEYEPKHAGALKWQGAAYQRLGQADKAIETLLASVACNPDDEETHWFLAEIYYDRDDIASAVQQLREFLRLDPGNQAVRDYLRKLHSELAIERNMDQLTTEHFKVKFEGTANLDMGRAVLDALERAYRKLGQDLDYYPEKEVTALLYADREFRSVTHVPDWTGAVFDGKIRIPLGGLESSSKAEIDSLILHEYTHAVVQMIAKGNCPAWLNEGLALYQSERNPFNMQAIFRYIVRSRPKDVLSLEDLEANLLQYDENAARVAYNQSFNAVSYLIATYGFVELKRLLLAFGAGRGTQEAILEVLGVPLDEFEGAFRRYALNWEG